MKTSVSVFLREPAAAYGTFADRTVRIAQGAPNADWENVLNQNIDDLRLLDVGRFNMRDASFNITGSTFLSDTRDSITANVGSYPAYQGEAVITIETPQGEITSIDVCQSLLNELKRGKKINFAYDKAEIRGAESFDLLNSLASAANQCSAFTFNIQGHTDADGSEAYNQRLSEARANLVVAYLSENGVERSRMSATGLGETQPIADNSTDAGKAQNRRIEFIVTESE